MPDTYAYKVRDKGGNILNGTIDADNEALVLARLREQGFVPLEVDKQRPRHEHRADREEGQAQGAVASSRGSSPR